MEEFEEQHVRIERRMGWIIETQPDAKVNLSHSAKSCGLLGEGEAEVCEVNPQEQGVVVGEVKGDVKGVCT